MKKFYTLIVAALFAATLAGQSPEMLQYQAVVRGVSGVIIVTTQVGMKISILQGSATGTPVCVEEFTPTTNAFGLVSIEIGTVNAAAFGAIDWSAGPYFVKVELDPDGATGGISYDVMGTSQLLSVPYALYAKKAGTFTETDPVFGAHAASGITSTLIGNWNTAFLWGDHSSGGYFANGGETAGTNRTLGNTDDFSLGFKTNNLTRLFIANDGKVGIGTNTPARLFHISDTEIFGNGLDDDLDGQADETGEELVFTSRGRLGIKTTSPSATLDVLGDVKIVDGTQGAGKVLTSDANGLASWEAPGGGGNHSVGELFGGGVIFYLWNDAGVEHGLIASLADVGTGVAWSSITGSLIGSTAQSPHDGQANTTAIVNQGAVSGAAYLCDNYSNDGFVDWYLPAAWELNILHNTAFVINTVAGVTDLTFLAYYWSSTELDATRAWLENFNLGDPEFPSKASTGGCNVRAIRRF